LRGIVTDRQFRRFHLFGRFWRPDWPRYRKLWKLGFPIGLAMGFEGGVFSAAAYLMGLIDAESVAAHAVALQIAAMAFMVPWGLSQAATVRVGRCLGEGDKGGLRGRLDCLGAGRRIHGADGRYHLVDPARADHNLPRRHAGKRPCNFAWGILPGDRGDLPGRRRGAGGRGGHASRPSRHTSPDDLHLHRLLGDRNRRRRMAAFRHGWQGQGIWTGLAIGLAIVAV
jgi:hypothetical protein